MLNRFVIKKLYLITLIVLAGIMLCSSKPIRKNVRGKIPFIVVDYKINSATIVNSALAHPDTLNATDLSNTTLHAEVEVKFDTIMLRKRAAKRRKFRSNINDLKKMDFYNNNQGRTIKEEYQYYINPAQTGPGIISVSIPLQNIRIDSGLNHIYVGFVAASKPHSSDTVDFVYLTPYENGVRSHYWARATANPYQDVFVASRGDVCHGDITLQTGKETCFQIEVHYNVVVNREIELNVSTPEDNSLTYTSPKSFHFNANVNGQTYVVQKGFCIKPQAGFTDREVPVLITVTDDGKPVSLWHDKTIKLNTTYSKSADYE